MILSPALSVVGSDLQDEMERTATLLNTPVAGTGNAEAAHNKDVIGTENQLQCPFQRATRDSGLRYKYMEMTAP